MAHYITRECVACNACVAQCPTDSISTGLKQFYIDSDTCTDCRACVPVCPTDAIMKLQSTP